MTVLFLHVAPSPDSACKCSHALLVGGDWPWTDVHNPPLQLPASEKANFPFHQADLFVYWLLNREQLDPPHRPFGR